MELPHVPTYLAFGGRLVGEDPAVAENTHISVAQDPNDPTKQFVTVTVKEKNFKDEDVKVEDTLVEPTMVPEALPLTIHVQDADPDPEKVACGEIPAKYATMESRMDILSWYVMKETGNAVRFDLLSNSAEHFINGEIDGLFKR